MRDLRSSLGLMCAIILIGSLLAACTALGPMFGGAKSELESIVGVTVAGDYTVTVSRGNKILLTETWICNTDGTKLTGCHLMTSQTVSTDIVPRKVP